MSRTEALAGLPAAPNSRRLIPAALSRAAGAILAALLLPLLVATASAADIQPGTYMFVLDRTMARVVVPGQKGNLAADMNFQLGELTFDKGGMIVNARADIDTGSVSTKNASSVSTLKGRYGFDSSRYPFARFESTTGSVQGDRVVMTGLLTIKDVTRPVELTGTLLRSNPRRVVMRLEGMIDRTAFGITAGRPVYGKDAKIILRIVALRERGGRMRQG
ncbi:YceI family protein [Acuticoccus kandeliae]|uniref:YceI family protein n=1 Tax=Acuticoccus kandeliae TaxID=2073160 RepID=UPI00130054DD|nr:YceI family protein [Acuticoccus kandeliae]